MIFRTLVGAAALLPLAAPALAQVSVAADLGTSSAYVSRGLSLTSRPVVQGDVYLTVPAPAGFAVTVGAWGNLEPRAYAADSHISMTAGEAGPNLTEVDYTVEASRQVGPASLALGVLRMTFPNEAGVTADYNTTEVIGSISAAGLPLAPSVAAYWDVDRVRGVYAETGVGHSFRLGRRLPLAVGAIAGWSAGEAPNPSDAEELFYYDEDGLTHVDLSASLPFTVGGVSIAPTLHGVLLNDPATRRVGPRSTRDHKVWVAVTASWTLPFGAAGE